MNLGKKIIILATLVVLGMQILSSVLEIGFLYRKIEAGYLTKYNLSVTAMARKLERSLLYGKKIDKLNYSRLLKGLIPKDAAGVMINDAEGKNLYSLNDLKISELEVIKKGDAVIKKRQHYVMAFPLFQRDEFKGNLFVFISDQGIKDKILPIIKDVAMKFFIIFLILIFMLYIILHLFMERPFGEYIANLKEAIAKKDQTILNSTGVDMSDYFRIEEIIDTLKNVRWLDIKSKDFAKQLKGDDINIKQKYVEEYEFVTSIQNLWEEIRDDVSRKQKQYE